MHLFGPKILQAFNLNRIDPVDVALASHPHKNNKDIRMDIFKPTFLGYTDYIRDISVWNVIKIEDRFTFCIVHSEAEKGEKKQEKKCVSFIGYAGPCATVLRTTVSNFSSDKGGVKNAALRRSSCEKNTDVLKENNVLYCICKTGHLKN